MIFKTVFLEIPNTGIFLIDSSFIYSVNSNINLDIGYFTILSINKKEITFKKYVVEFLFVFLQLPSLNQSIL